MQPPSQSQRVGHTASAGRTVGAWCGVKSTEQPCEGWQVWWSWAVCSSLAWPSVSHISMTQQATPPPS